MKRWQAPPSEVALAAAVTVLMAVDLQAARWPWLGLALVVVAGGSLAWRLRLPELPLLLICAVNLLLAVTAPGEFGPQTPFLGVLVAVYTAAARLRGRRALAAALVALVLVWFAHVGTRDGDVADFWPFVLWGAPWLVGRLSRRQGAKAALELSEAAQRERDRIARELHDVVAHSVSLMVVQAGAERLAHPDSPSVGALSAIEDHGRQALVELRAMLGVLRSTEGEERDPQPDLASLPALVEQVRGAGLPVELRVTGGEVPAGVALSTYRVVQEALTNALRHGATPTTVTVAVTDEVTVEVRNALGRKGSDSPGSGRGVTGMRERTALHGGTLQAGPERDDWVVRARLPLSRSVV